MFKNLTLKLASNVNRHTGGEGGRIQGRCMVGNHIPKSQEIGQWLNSVETVWIDIGALRNYHTQQMCGK
jgi:hypothetical protein